MLIFLGVAFGYIIYKGLDPWDLLKVAVGLGLVIFIHELGHFLAAKACDVHVEAFSIGFGKPIPGLHFKYGETMYKIGWIPLGGYVKMVGEGENSDTEEAEEDPRSFKNKPVTQRMIIISAGVIMNILLAWICFIIAYSHGVNETAPIIGSVTAGSPAWQEGLRSDSYIERLNSLDKPVFEDLKPTVMSSDKNEKVRFVVREAGGTESRTIDVIPVREEGSRFPLVGVGPATKLQLAKTRKPVDKVFAYANSPVAAAGGLRMGDFIIAASDPADGMKLTPISEDKREGAAGRLDYFDFYRRMKDSRGQPLTITVKHDDNSTEDVVIDPAFFFSHGMRMAMGRVAAIRKNGPSSNAVAVPADDNENGIRPRPADVKEAGGDRIITVEVTMADGKRLRWETDPQPTTEPVEKDLEVRALDPLRLPFELELWAESKPTDWDVRVTVLRPTARKEEKTESKKVTLLIKYDQTARYSQEMLNFATEPLPIPGMGLAYFVDAVVEAVEPDSPAAEAGIEKGDLIKAVRQKVRQPDGSIKEEKWEELKINQWAYVFFMLQKSDPREISIRVQRKDELKELNLGMREDKTWPRTERGFVMMLDTRLHKADDLVDAFQLGVHRTLRTVKVIYQNLYAMAFGRVSIFTMSGPLTIADVSYKIAGEDIWQFILFIGMINVNLAIINFLPIPMLDGGHMVFLIYEKIRGKPAPESVMLIALYIGLAAILLLMCFVLYLDISRMFF